MKRVLAGVFLGVSFLASSAAADDKEAQRAVSRVLSEEVAAGEFADAKLKLERLLAKCTSSGCGGATRATIHVALGMVASQLGFKEEARGQFARAVTADPDTKLPSRTTPDIRREFAETRLSVLGAEAKEKGGGKEGAGFQSEEAFREAELALSAFKAGKLDQCIEHNEASLRIEEQPRTRLLLANCLDKSGKLISALRNAQTALEVGMDRRDTALMRVAREKIERLVPRIPHVTFVPPSGVTEFSITFDKKELAETDLRKQFAVDPGEHKVHAEGIQNNLPLTFDETYTLREGDNLTVMVTLRLPKSELAPGTVRCMLEAKNQDDVAKCFPGARSPFVVRAGLGISGYSDSLHVNVASPELTANVASATGGWHAGGKLLVDVVSAASPDVVSHASAPFREKRYAGSVNGGYKPGPWGVTAFGNLSTEPDYRSLGGGAAVTLDLKEKLITPRLALSYTKDTIGRAGTPFSVFSQNFGIAEVEGGVTLVLSPTTLLLVGGSLQVERGNQSKPYRYVPMFDPDTAAEIPKGLVAREVNAARQNVRALENLPRSRDRYALAGRLATRIGQATLRLEERLYYDSWAMMASTTDARYIFDVGPRVRVWPHVRAHVQSKANFQDLAYVVDYDRKTGEMFLPTYRTTDRELASLLTLTGGGGVRLGFGSDRGSTEYGLTLQVDFMQTQFSDTLYVSKRSALYGSALFDVEFH